MHIHNTHFIILNMHTTTLEYPYYYVVIVSIIFYERKYYKKCYYSIVV